MKHNILIQMYEKKILEFIKKKFNIEIELEIPKNYGDLAIPCFVFAKKLKKSPIIIAQELSNSLNKNKENLKIEKAEAINAYVNIYLPSKIIKEILEKISTKFEIKNPKKIMIEYSSPNANKPQHLGHARNNFLGMAIINLLKNYGNEVIKANLINDKGLGVAKLIYGYMNHNIKEPNKKSDHYVGDLYVFAEKKLKENPEDDKLIKEILVKWEKKDPEIISIWKKLRDYVMKGYEITYKKIGAKFDVYYYESEIFEGAKEIIEDGLKKKVFIKDETNAIIAKLEPKLPNKVILRKDGTSLYITNDLILAKKKLDYNIESSIYVVGNEQDMYFQQLFEILKKLEYSYADNCYHLSYGMVNLPDGKMKSREGKVVDIDDLIQEMEDMAKKEINKRESLTNDEVNRRAEIIALGAFKFFILKIDPKKDMVFNPEESISFDGETGPYIQYVYARINSLLKKSNLEPGDFSNLGKEEWKLTKILSNYKQIIHEATISYKPSLIANYLIELSQSFNEYYHSTPILKAEEKIILSRLAFIKKIQSIIKHGLELLTIDVLDKM